MIKLYFFQILSLVMGKVIKKERGLELVNSHSSGYEKVQKNAFIGYI